MFGDINILIIIELSNSLAFFIILSEYLRNLNCIDISKLVFGGVVLAGIMKLDVNRALLFGLGTVVVLLTVSAGLICILLANSNKEK